MIVAELTSALLLANASAQAAGIPPFQFAELSATTAQTQDDATHATPGMRAETLLAASVADEPFGYADPAVSIVPAETIEKVSSPQQIADLPISSATTETDKPLQEESEIIVTARTRTPIDPLQNINAESYAITQAIDEAVVEPSAHAYEKVMPEPVRNGLRNFANNLHEPAVFVNFLLQLNPGRAAETAGRFLVNSIVGVAGLFDIAKRKPINLPRRRNGFADTLRPVDI